MKCSVFFHCYWWRRRRRWWWWWCKVNLIIESSSLSGTHGGHTCPYVPALIPAKSLCLSANLSKVKNHTSFYVSTLAWGYRRTCSQRKNALVIRPNCTEVCRNRFIRRLNKLMFQNSVHQAEISMRNVHTVTACYSHCTALWWNVV
jgi:hypothetical protein